MPSVAVAIAADHPSFAGHFPGQPILPGVAVLAEVMEALLSDAEAGPALGASPRLGAVKFVAPCGPGDTLRIDWQLTLSRIAFDVRRRSAGNTDIVAATGHFERTSA